MHIVENVIPKIDTKKLFVYKNKMIQKLPAVPSPSRSPGATFSTPVFCPGKEGHVSV